MRIPCARARRAHPPLYERATLRPIRDEESPHCIATDSVMHALDESKDCWLVGAGAVRAGIELVVGSVPGTNGVGEPWALGP